MDAVSFPGRTSNFSFMISRNSATGPSALKITNHFDYNIFNIIYYIQLSHCYQLYTGETGRRLGDRIRDYLYDIRKNDLISKTASRHFNSSNHNIFNFFAFGRYLIKGGNSCRMRKTKEMRLIHTLGTLNPNGINERFAKFFCLLTYFVLTHLYPFILFCFLHTCLIALSIFP